MTNSPRGNTVEKRDIVGEPVAVSSLEAEGRNLSLAEFESRAVLRGEIHELITTAEAVGPGDTVRDVAYVGFFEVSQGGSLRIGDVLRQNSVAIGRLAGFDLTHMPNHLNIVITSEKRRTGKDLNLRLTDEIRFTLE